jgi:alpha-glucosidase
VLRLILIAWMVVQGIGCRRSEGPVAPGGFTVDVEDGRLSIRAPDGALVLDSADPARSPPLAFRNVPAKVETQFGSFRFFELNAPWTSATRFERGSDEDQAIHLRGLSDAGEVVGTLDLDSPAGGVLRLRARAASGGMNRAALAFRCSEQDRFLGFGAQSDALDHRGHTVPIWTSEPGIGKSEGDEPPALWMLEGARHASSFGLPTWLSQRGYIGVLASDGRSVFELCSAHPDVFRMETWQDTLEVHLHWGPAPAKALERATGGILGRPMRPPPVAFAPWHDAIYGSDHVRHIARLLREHQIPSSVLWTEDFRGGHDVEPQGYRLKEGWSLDRALYPDAEALADELRRDGFAWHAYFNTFLVEGTEAFAEALAGDHLVRGKDGAPRLFTGVTFKPTGLADLSRPQTREWVKGYLRRALDHGFDGWMADYGEWLPTDVQLASGEDPFIAHNRYPLEWARLNHEVLAERAADGRQRLFFARSGWLGSTSFTPVVWAGDQRTDFQRDDGMPTVVTMGLNIGLSGVSTWGHDIAGYQSATNAPSTRELYFRWTSLGALSPVMRTHHGLNARQNWWFGKDAETIDHFARWAQLHIRLFPYLDGASVEAETRGMPLMRALPLVFPDDARVWPVHDQYLLGPALMVAPVLEAGATGRRVLLPEGRWYPLPHGAPLSGPGEAQVEAALTELPLFGRAGTIVPLLPHGVQTLLPTQTSTVDLQDVSDQRVLWVFAGAEGSFTERDGTRYTLRTDGGAGETFSEAGVPLPDCTGDSPRGCVDRSGTAVRVLLAGNGPLTFAGHVLSIQGPERTVDVVVHR